MIRGYKVFKPDWSCRDKIYTCPGKFEEKVKPKLGGAGMHFCYRLIDCFSYYRFSPDNHIAEVIAYGEFEANDEKVCTNKLEIVREISWFEALSLINLYPNNYGMGNTGTHNYGHYNTANRNDGNNNTGSYNRGNNNSGSYNIGGANTGDSNVGAYNCGSFNTGEYNTGNKNIGDYNTGTFNHGDNNTGDFNVGDNHTGCFNTEPQILSFFNKPSCWTWDDWVCSSASCILSEMPQQKIRFNSYSILTDEEKAFSSSETLQGRLSIVTYDAKVRQKWWDKLNSKQKDAILSLPNFDAEIFKQITGIDIHTKC